MINRGRWLRWAYENLNEVDYLRALKAVRADQGEETPRASRSDASWPAGEEQ